MPARGETERQDWGEGDHMWLSVGRAEGLMSCTGQGLHSQCRPQGSHRQAGEAEP